MNDHWTSEPVHVLTSLMSMPPRYAVKFGTEAVCEGASRCDWALSDTRRAVKPRRACLQETMPMDRSALGGQVVGNGYLNPVSPVCLDEWSRAISRLVML